MTDAQRVSPLVLRLNTPSSAWGVWTPGPVVRLAAWAAGSRVGRDFAGKEDKEEDEKIRLPDYGRGV